MLFFGVDLMVFFQFIVRTWLIAPFITFLCRIMFKYRFSFCTTSSHSDHHTRDENILGITQPVSEKEGVIPPKPYLSKTNEPQLLWFERIFALKT